MRLCVYVCVFSVCVSLWFTQAFLMHQCPQPGLATWLPLNIWKSAPFYRANHRFFGGGDSGSKTHTLKQQPHTHTHSQSHIGTAWNAFYADWVQALSWSESRLKFDTQLRGAVSPPLARGASQSHMAATAASRTDIHTLTETFWLLVNLFAFFVSDFPSNFFFCFRTWGNAWELSHFFQSSKLFSHIKLSHSHFKQGILGSFIFLQRTTTAFSAFKNHSARLWTRDGHYKWWF